MTLLNKYYEILLPIDTFALGFSSRVGRAIDFRSGDYVAFKVMRREHLADETVWGLFAIEAKLLGYYYNQPNAAKLIDCGFVNDIDHALPSTGEVESFEQNIKDFAEKYRIFLSKMWRPYIVVNFIPTESSLLNLTSLSQGTLAYPTNLSSNESSALAIAYMRFLEYSHEMEILYVDHKPEHVFWNRNHMHVIDFNVSRLLSDTYSLEEKKLEKRRDIRNAVIGVLFTIFTGQDFRYHNSTQLPPPHDPYSIDTKFAAPAIDFGVQSSLSSDLVNILNEAASTDSRLTASDLVRTLNNSFTTWRE